MQIPEPLPPLAPLWDRVLRAQTLPPDIDVNLLHVAIRDRLTHSEWEVRLNALRVLADLVPLSGNALTFPLDQVIENLGHSSPNVRKAALDSLKTFCTHCDKPEAVARTVLDKCSYRNNSLHPNYSEINVITGLILSIPSVINILKRRCLNLDLSLTFNILGKKLLNHNHREVAWRSLVKLRRICGPRDFMMYISGLDTIIQDKFRLLCDLYDEDSLDVYYGPRNVASLEIQTNQLIRASDIFSSSSATPIRISTDSSSDDSLRNIHFYNNYGKVVIETEIQFDSDTAITMTVLEENETESEATNLGSEDDRDSSDRNTLRYSDTTDNDSEDTDVVVKKVRFGGETIKIRTPDSENQCNSEEDSNQKEIEKEGNTKEATFVETPAIVNKTNELKSEIIEIENKESTNKKSGIPLPVIPAKKVPSYNQDIKVTPVKENNQIKQKSRSMNELYDYFRAKSKQLDSTKVDTGYARTINETKSPEKIPSPVQPHREVEVLHNLQRSPLLSPRRRISRSYSDDEGSLIHNALSRFPQEHGLIYPRPISPLRYHYDWEDYGLLPTQVLEKLHDTENWIATVKATNQLHSVLLEEDTVARIEPVAYSLIQHMWALSKSVGAARVSAEGAVCALFRNASNDCARKLLPALVSRLSTEPPPAALPHALLQRVSLNTLIDLIFNPSIIQVKADDQSKTVKAALCLARAAGPAAVMSAVRAHLAESERADKFCHELRESLNKPLKSTKQGQFSRASHLPIPIRRRAKSTPPAAVTVPRKLRPLPDSAPLNGSSKAIHDAFLKPLEQDSAADRRHHHRIDDVPSLSLINGNGIHEKEIYKIEELPVNDTTDINGAVILQDDNVDDLTTISELPPKSPSIKIQDYSDKSEQSVIVEEPDEDEPDHHTDTAFYEHDVLSSHQSVESVHSQESSRSPYQLEPDNVNQTSSQHSPVKSSVYNTPEPELKRCERDVRTALNECLVPAKLEDWEVTVSRLTEIERLSSDLSAIAPAASWRAAVRAVASHVRSLRSRVARTACKALGSLFENRGKILDPELDEAIGALLERCADVNRFIRVDAADALVQIARGGSNARVAVALSRRGSTHRAGPVRAAATRALANLVQYHGASRVLDMPQEPRTILLRAVGDLLGDANPETRQQARLLCISLTEDSRFRNMLKVSVAATQYRNILKHMERLHIA